MNQIFYVVDTKGDLFSFQSMEKANKFCEHIGLHTFQEPVTQLATWDEEDVSHICLDLVNQWQFEDWRTRVISS